MLQLEKKCSHFVSNDFESSYTTILSYNNNLECLQDFNEFKSL